MTLVDTLVDAARSEIYKEIALVEQKTERLIQKASRKANIALGLSLHDKVTEYYAPKIAAALRDGLSQDDLIAAITAAKKKSPKKDDTKKAAQDNEAIASGAVASNVTFDTSGIQNILQDLYGDAGIIGAHVAGGLIGKIPAGSDFATILPSINWSTWQPGDIDAAAKVANGQLKDVLDNAHIVIQGITDDALDRMGNILAEGLNQGLAPATIARNMRELGISDARATVIARTETGRAQVSSSIDTYVANDTQQVSWHSNPGACPACIALDEGSPYDIDDVPYFPHHPSDRCQVIPYFADL